MTMDKEREAQRDVSDALDRIGREGRDAILTLQNGIVLRCHSVPPLYVRALLEQFTPPPPPRVRVEQPGQEPWEEENPDDPAWKRTCAELSARSDVAVTRLFLALGTEVVSVPDGVFGPNDDGWLEQIRRVEKLTGIEVPIDLSDEPMRRLSWLIYYALDNNEDLAVAGYLPQFLGGLQEGAIAKAIDTFRDLRERGADQDSPVPEAAVDRNNGNRASRRRRP